MDTCSEHDLTIWGICHNIKEKGFQGILMNHWEDFQSPPAIFSSTETLKAVPDIWATSPHNVDFIFEIETENTLNGTSIHHWYLFPNFAKSHEKLFVIVIPQRLEEMTKRLLSLNRIDASIWVV